MSDPIEPPARPQAARDRAVRHLLAALDRREAVIETGALGGTVTLPVNRTVHLRHGGSPPAALRRWLRQMYATAEGTQPPGDALRAMYDTLWSRADEFSAARESLPPVDQGEVSRGETDESIGEAVFDRDADGGSQADLAVALAEEAGIELWHTPAGEAYATTTKDNARDHRRVAATDFKRWMQALFFAAHGKAIRRDSLSDALGVLEGRALMEPEHDVHVRVAEHEGRIYIDLADRERRIVEISTSGWRVGQDAPVRFRRPKGSLPLPVPVQGGSIDDLRPLINVADDDGWVLFVGFVIAALHPSGPYFVLVLVGEQGTAKSTATRLVVGLLDPKDAPVRRPPRDERDLAIAARHGRIVAFNNLSHLSDSLSDSLSSLATEGGFVTRALFTDDDEARFKERRPIVANGIPDFVTRGDLADRSIKLVLQRITKRRYEASVLAEFEQVRPRVLGAMFNAVSEALRNRDGVVLDDPPRMADATRWVTAAESAFGWPPGRFLAAYRRCIATTYAAVVEADPVAGALLAFATASGWCGSAGDLFQVLKCPGGDQPGAARDRGWPKTPHGMGGALRRLAPALRRAGVEVTDLGTDRVRRVQMWHIAQPTDAGSVAGEEASQGSQGSDEAQDHGPEPSRREPSCEPSLFDKARAPWVGETKAVSLASLASLPIPPLPGGETADDEGWYCDPCGAWVAEDHDCPGAPS